MPEGADTVIAVEDTNGPPWARWSAAPPRRGRYVRPRGEDVATGAVIVSAGEVVGARTVALLAACGHADVEVHRRPHVVVLSTGAELVEPGKPLGPGQIHDSNSSMLWAAAVGAGASAEIRAAVGDSDDELLAVLDEVVGRADVVITSGGVSMGAYDVVKSALRGEGIEFVKVAMQPGQPQGYGLLTGPEGKRVPLFALPGNPVSSFVSFEVFVRPALRRLMRLTPEKRRSAAASSSPACAPPRGAASSAGPSCRARPRVARRRPGGGPGLALPRRPLPGQRPLRRARGRHRARRR